jgi:broad specificity phosphatase PhoE
MLPCWMATALPQLNVSREGDQLGDSVRGGPPDGLAMEWLGLARIDSARHCANRPVHAMDRSYRIMGGIMDRRLFLATFALSALPAAARDSVWRRLTGGGHVLLLRHAATVPGVGEPPGFQMDACATQRNLSTDGKADARRLGAAFRRQGVPVADVLSSRWCRCLDTARLAFGSVKPFPMLDSMFQDDEASRQRKLAELRRYLASFKEPGNLVLVTHDVNIRALVGQSVNQGDMVVAVANADGSLRATDILPLPRLQ